MTDPDQAIQELVEMSKTTKSIPPLPSFNQMNVNAIANAEENIGHLFQRYGFTNEPQPQDLTRQEALTRSGKRLTSARFFIHEALEEAKAVTGLNPVERGRSAKYVLNVRAMHVKQRFFSDTQRMIKAAMRWFQTNSIIWDNLQRALNLIDQTFLMPLDRDLDFYGVHEFFDNPGD